MATALKTQTMTEAEWAARQQLAACYRVFAMMGWDEMIFNHITVKLDEPGAFLINPYGLHFSEELEECVSVEQAHCYVDYNLCPLVDDVFKPFIFASSRRADSNGGSSAASSWLDGSCAYLAWLQLWNNSRN